MSQSTTVNTVHVSEEASKYSQYKVIRRDQTVMAFDQTKIQVAITKAFLATEGETGTASSRVHDLVNKLTVQVIDALTRRIPQGGIIHLEDIQDQVELALMRSGEHEVLIGPIGCLGS